MKLAALLLPILLTAPATGDELKVRPITNTRAGYFAAELNPGESADFTLRITATSDENLRSFVTDAAPLVNGGFGLSEEPSRSGAWFSYAPQTFPATGERLETYSLTVPMETPPGEYALGVVVETAYQEQNDGISHRLRQAVPVNVTVPGPEEPKFSYGDAEASFKPNRFAVLVDVINEGNRHIAPEGKATVRDGAGNVVTEGDVKMGSVYTGTTAQAELRLASALQPGTYSVEMDTTDKKSGVRATATGIPLLVEGSYGVTGEEKNLAPVIQDGQGWLLPVIAGLLVLILLGLLVLLIRNRRT